MYDLMIQNGRLYDGSGDASDEGDAAIEGDRIFAVGEIDVALIGEATQEVDATGPTTLIQHWGRDRTRGKQLPLERSASLLRQASPEESSAVV